MNAFAEGFSDSDSFYTKRHTILTDVNSGTALSERESLTLEDFGGPVVRYPYESQTANTNPRVLIPLDVLDVPHPLLDAARVLILSLLQRQRSLVLPPSDASTLPFPFTRRSELPIEIDWSSCLTGFVDEEIEDGMTASLGEKISNLIRFHGSEAVKRLKGLISSNELSPSLASHTLRWLGRIKDSASFDSRLELLCESLRSKSPAIRDGASLGLAALGSTKAIPFLLEAIEREKLPGLRADLEQVRRKLQN